MVLSKNIRNIAAFSIPDFSVLIFFQGRDGAWGQFLVYGWKCIALIRICDQTAGRGNPDKPLVVFDYVVSRVAGQDPDVFLGVFEETRHAWMFGNARFGNETSGLPGILAQSPFRTDIHQGILVHGHCAYHWCILVELFKFFIFRIV